MALNYTLNTCPICVINEYGFVASSISSERLVDNAGPLQWVHQECYDRRGKTRLDGHGRAAQHSSELLPGSMIAKREKEREREKDNCFDNQHFLQFQRLFEEFAVAPGLTCHIFTDNDFFKT